MRRGAPAFRVSQSDEILVIHWWNIGVILEWEWWDIDEVRSTIQLMKVWLAFYWYKIVLIFCHRHITIGQHDLISSSHLIVQLPICHHHDLISTFHADLLWSLFSRPPWKRNMKKNIIDRNQKFFLVLMIFILGNHKRIRKYFSCVGDIFVRWRYRPDIFPMLLWYISLVIFASHDFCVGKLFCWWYIFVGDIFPCCWYSAGCVIPRSSVWAREPPPPRLLHYTMSNLVFTLWFSLQITTIKKLSFALLFVN